ncbi:MAG TPA: DMT family transporter [Candidatus Glassbacteria bacterium]|nr:DMT family transporter [Candidatus Glassbacteria bacterium]
MTDETASIEVEENTPEVMKKAVPRLVYILLAVAIIMTSFASTLIRLAGKNAAMIGTFPADAAVIAFWRLLFATIGMFFGALVTRNLGEFKKVSFKKDIPLLALSGLLLGIHFATWNESLRLTTVASSITILYLMPLFALLLSVLFLKEKASWGQVIVILLTVSGAIVVGISDLITQGLGTLVGDLLAVAGAISVAGYFVIGRKKREKLDIFSYTTIVYGFCTVFLFLYILIFNSAYYSFNHFVTITFHLEWQHFLMFLLLAIGPSCLGHTLYNYSLGYVRTPVITVTALGEMFGATLLAMIFLEYPTWTAFGMILVAAGIIVTAVLENKALTKKALAKPEKNENNTSKELS